MTLSGGVRVGLAALVLAAPRAGADVPAAGAAPACRARTSSEPTEGYPGQQLLWRLEIQRTAQVTDVDWIEPPAFPGFRVEWLPGRPEQGAVSAEGVEWITRFEERALFAEQPGEFVIAPKGLRCSLAGGAQQTTSIPPTRVRVLALPVPDRPPDDTGLVGNIAVAATLQPRVLALGSSARLEVTLHGDANLWDARDPLVGTSGFEGVEVFAARPRLELEPGLRLGVRRQFVYDLVPSREGRIAIPEVRVPYFDPALRRHAVATSSPLVLEVGPRATGALVADAVRAASPAEDVSAGMRALATAALLLLATASAGVWLYRRRARERGHAAILAALAGPASGDEPARLARALRLALAPALPEARSAAVEELRAPAGASPACERALALLARIERARFDPHAPGAPRAEVIAAIQALARG